MGKLKVIHTPYYNINLLALSQKGNVEGCLIRTFMFTEESKYETKDPKDQGDWNKLTGLASYLFDSQKSSHMWAWRYYKGNFEVAPYSHNHDGTRILPKEDQITIIPMNVKFTTWVIVEDNINSVFFVVISDLDDLINKKFIQYACRQPLLLLPKKSYRIITSWFGGDSLPKKTVKIYG